jgi:hypothetical protein
LKLKSPATPMNAPLYVVYVFFKESFIGSSVKLRLVSLFLNGIQDKKGYFKEFTFISHVFGPLNQGLFIKFYIIKLIYTI